MLTTKDVSTGDYVAWCSTSGSIRTGIVIATGRHGRLITVASLHGYKYTQYHTDLVPIDETKLTDEGREFVNQRRTELGLTVHV